MRSNRGAETGLKDPRYGCQGELISSLAEATERGRSCEKKNLPTIIFLTQIDAEDSKRRFQPVTVQHESRRDSTVPNALMM